MQETRGTMVAGVNLLRFRRPDRGEAARMLGVMARWVIVCTLPGYGKELNDERVEIGTGERLTHNRYG